MSLADSLKGGNPYEEIDDKFHPGLFDSKVSKIREESSKTVMSSKDFEDIGINYDNNVVNDSELDDPAVITYTTLIYLILNHIINIITNKNSITLRMF